MTKDKLLERLLQNWPSKLLSLSAAIVLFFFAAISGMTEYQITVPINYQLPEGLVPAREAVSQARIIFKGDTRHIDTLKSLSLKSEDFQVSAIVTPNNNSGEHTVNLDVRMTRNGQDLSRLGFERIEPSRITIFLEPVSVKTVKVGYNLSGNPAKGFQVGAIQVEPNTVRIEGPRQHLENISSLSTEAIDLSDKDQSFMQKYRVQSDNPLVRVRPVDRVQVQVEIIQSFDEVVYGDVRIELEGLLPGLTVSSNNPRGFLRVRQARFDSTMGIRTLQLPRLVADCKSILGPGTYTVVVTPQVPVGMEAIEHIPRALTLEVSQSNGEESE
jgi:hypothetical protein